MAGALNSCAMKNDIASRLEYIRGEIVAERVSYAELAELK